MTAVKVVAVLVGAFLVLGVVFVEPARNLSTGPHPGAAAPLVLFGLLVVGVGAWLLIRRVIREARRRRSRG